MKRSFTNLLLFYILGIIIFYFVNIPSKLILLMFFISIVCLSYNIIKKTLNQRVLLAFIFILAMLITLVNESGKLEKNIDQEVYIKALVEDLNKKNLDLEKYVISVREINGEAVGSEKALLTIIGEKNLKLGSEIYFKASPKLPMENTNPGLFNYRLYLKSKKIYSTMTVEAHTIEKIDIDNIAFKYKLKEGSINRIEKLFEPYLNEKNNLLITSIILGNSDYLNKEDVQLYRDMGLAHILAVSGLHIGIISSFLMFIISRLGIKRKSNVIITLIFIWTYGYIIGYPDSILRASILFSFLYLSKILHRVFDSINILSLAALILLFINPYSLFSVGFQLSFVASGSIIIFTQRIVDLLYPFKGKVIDTISSLLAVNIGVLPIQAYYFNRISILGFLANIIIVPILSFSLIIAFIMVGLELVFPSFNIILARILNLSLSFQFFILKLLESFPRNIIKIHSPDIATILSIYLIVFIIFDLIDIRSFGKKTEKAIIIYLIFLIFFNLVNIKESMEIHFIDVGQGDSILIKLNKKNLLIDTGGSIFKNNNISENIVLPYLEKIGVRSLDAIFITHFHEDHCQGLPLMLQEFKVKNIFISHTPTEEYLKLMDKNKFTFLRKGNSIDIDKNTSFKILWPMEERDYEENLNNKSMVGLLNYKGIKALFTGDIECQVEEKLLDNIDKVDILKVAHHGSDTSSIKSFIEKTNPEISLISVGRNNIYSHPSKEVLDELKEVSQVYRTDKNGLVKIIIEDGYKVDPYLIEGEKQDVSLEDYLLGNHNFFLCNLLFFLISYYLIRVYAGALEEELINDL